MKDTLTPYEILYRILSNRGFPSLYNGYEIEYYKLNAECDIKLKLEDIKNDKKCVYHIDKKIEIMKNLIEKLQEQKIIIPDEYTPIKELKYCNYSLFGDI